MDAFLIALETVLPLFLIIFTGWVFSKTGTATSDWVEVLNKYALWIGFPALVVVSLMQLQAELKTFLPLIILNSAYIIGSILLVFPIAWLFRLSVKMRQALFLIFPFGNVAYLGIPVLENAHGEEALPVAAIIAAVYVFWMLTLALVLIEVYEKKAVDIGGLLLRLLKNPLLLSVFAGIAIVSFQLDVPGMVKQWLGFFSQSVTAVVLFSLGIFLGMQKAGTLREWSLVALLSLTAMVVLPAIFYAVIHRMALPGEAMKASILEAAMPLGLTPYALAVQYNLKSKLFARIVVFATLASIIILPLWIFLLQ